MKKSLLCLLVLLAAILVLTACSKDPSCQHDDPSQIKILEGREPTCFRIGITEGKKCERCGLLLIPHESIAKADCIPGEWVVDQAATKTTNGLKHQDCTVCGKKVNEQVIVAGSQGLTYAVRSDGVSCKITGIGTCTDTELVIPASIDGYVVTMIDQRAFMDCASIVSVVVPDSVTSIGAEAFTGCTSLSYNKYNNGRYIGTESNPYHCFVKPTDRSVDHFELNSNTKVIAEIAFQNCDSLISVNIPDAVCSIGTQALSYCPSLQSITVSQNNPYFESIDGNLYSEDGKILIQYAAGKEAKEFAIPHGVKVIETGAFRNSDSLETIIIPESVKAINDLAFRHCSALKDIYYVGSADQWAEINISADEFDLENVTIHYNYVPEN